MSDIIPFKKEVVPILTEAQNRWLTNLRATEGPNSSTLALIDNLMSINAKLRAENKRLTNALVHITEYLNGVYNEKAMSDAFDEIVASAREALSAKEPQT